MLFCGFLPVALVGLAAYFSGEPLLFASLYPTVFGFYNHLGVLAAGSSVAVAEALLLLVRLPHTPAGTTTLPVCLGLFTTPRELASIAVGIVLLTAISWCINRSLGASVPVWGPKR